MKKYIDKGTIVFLAVIISITLIFVVGAIAIISTSETPEGEISVEHIVTENVTCFVWRGEFDCIPDWQLSPPSD